MFERFYRVQHNIVNPHALGQRDMLRRHAACCRKNAHRVTGKDLEQQRVNLFSREAITEVCHRRIAVLEGVPLHRDEQLGAMGRERQVNDDTHFIALSFP